MCNFSLCTFCIILYYDMLLDELGAPPAQATWGENGTAAAGAEGEPAPSQAIPAADRPSAASGRRVEMWVLDVLLLNAWLGLVLSTLGPLLVRRWVLQPVADLRQAAQQIAAGEWSVRIRPRSGDELGLLAGELNDTMAAIVRLQGHLSERERQVAAGETLRCVFHNIRSPLTGIRWLAEVVSLRLARDPEAVAKQNQIISIVDRLIGWLRDLRQGRVHDSAAEKLDEGSEARGASKPWG